MKYIAYKAGCIYKYTLPTRQGVYNVCILYIYVLQLRAILSVNLIKSTRCISADKLSIKSTA